MSDDRDVTSARALVKLLEAARPMPLLHTQRRVNKRRVYELADSARREQSWNSDGEVLKAAEAVRDAVYNAKPVPLTDDVRLPHADIHRLLAGLRAAGAA